MSAYEDLIEYANTFEREGGSTLIKLIDEAVDEARQEGWQDGYFEAGGLGGTS